MRVSLKWLSELVELPADPALVAEKLTSVGLEVEAIADLGAALELPPQPLAAPVERLAGRDLDPPFADAVLLDIRTLLVIEAYADVMFEDGCHVIGTPRVG